LAQQQDYLSGVLTDPERLANAQAITRGVFSGLEYLLDRVASYQGLLDLELEDNPGAQVYLKESNEALAHAREVYAHLSAVLSHQPEQFESIDLSVLLEGVATRLKKSGYSNVTTSFAGDDQDHPATWGHFFLLNQLLLNVPSLLGISGSAPLTIIGAQAEFDQEFAQRHKSALEPGQYCTLQLGSQTTPIPADQWTTPFEYLVKHGTTSPSSQLIYSSGIVQQHAGDLFFGGQDSDTLILLLPVRDNAALMYDEKNTDEDLSGIETVLLVDDEGIIWDVVIDMLQNLGYTVVLAEHGKDCVEIYSQNQGSIDLVLLDMVMPEMNGRDAFYALKEIDPNVNVLLSSGYVKEGDAQDVLDAGALGFLQKPYRMVDLAKAIREIFDR
jgi:CheY-like chemotaxis protein